MALACLQVKAKRGYFVVFGDDKNCTYKLNGKPINESLQTTRGYGLLEVQCEDCTYNIISKFEGCDDCAICTHNEGNSRCSSLMIPLSLAVLSTALICIIIFSLLAWLECSFDIFSRCLHHANKSVEKRNQDKRSKKYDDIAQELQKRAFLNRTMGKFETIKIESPSSDNENRAAQPVPSTSGSTRTSRAAKTPTLSRSASMLSLAILNALTPSKACSDNLFLGSNGIMYKDNEMSHISTGLAFFTTGSSLCVKSPDGSTESLMLDHITHVTTYSPIYKACDYTLDVKSTYNCLGSGMCWSSQNCKSGVRYSKVGSKAYTVPENQSGCYVVPNLSETSCLHEQICIWYYWDMMLSSTRCDTIYERMYSESIAHFQYKDKAGNIMPLTLSLSNPTSTTPIITNLISINTFSASEPTMIRQHGSVYMTTKASSLNQPIPGILGDAQKSLKNDSWVYPTWAIKCFPSGSRVECQLPESSYNRSLSIDQHSIIDVSSDSLIGSLSTKMEVRGSLTLMLRTLTSPAQVIKDAQCDFSVDAIHGCVACEEMPFIIVSASNIQKTGLVKFSSNCSFYINRISCSPNPQMIPLLEKPDSCEIKILGTNQTMVIKMTYQFRGDLIKMGIMSYSSEESFKEKLLLGFQSPSFYNSLKYSLGLGFLTTTSIAVIKLIVKYSAFKAGQAEVQALK